MNRMYLSQEVFHYASPTTILFSAAVFLIGLVYVLEYYRRRAVSRETSPRPRSRYICGKYATLDVECNLPNCVRCSKSLDIFHNARRRLSYYSVPLGNQNEEMKNDVSNLKRDLQRSELLQKSSLDRSRLREMDGESVNSVITSTPTVFFMRGLREHEFFLSDEFPGLEKLVDMRENIWLEFLHLYQSPLPETTALWKSNTTGGGKWELAHLLDQGRPTQAGELCPLTMSYLFQLPSFMQSNLFGNAAFSIVHPQTEITPHCGPTNIRIRCHLGLKVPPISCKLQVNDTVVGWEEGEVLCFNDAFPHAVHSKGEVDSGMRVVLLVDLWHPDVSKPQQNLFNFVFSPTG